MRARILLMAVALFVATAVFAAAPATPASANGGGVHCVKYGETLYGIGYMYGVSAQAIAHHNGIMNPNFVRAGACLQIPSAYHGGWQGGHDGGWKGGDDGWKGGYHGGQGQQGCYWVRWGDTLSSIAWRNGTSTWAIANANGLWNPNHIRAGQCLHIPRW